MKYTKELGEEWKRLAKYGCDTFGSGVVMSLVDEIDRLQSELVQMKEEARWIPVSERFPENVQVVLLHNRVNSETTIATFRQLKRYAIWYIEDQEYNVKKYETMFNLWRPLPAPEV